MNDARHLVRAFGIVAVLLAAVFFIRGFFIPPTFGQLGPYRAESPKEEMAKAPVYQGDDYCSTCHEEDWDTVADGKHVAIPCENCHFLPNPHAEGEKKLVDMPVDRSRSACVICHQYLPSRPAKFPQVKDFEKHVKDHWKTEMGEAEKEPLCGKCHKAHDPRVVKTG